MESGTATVRYDEEDLIVIVILENFLYSGEGHEGSVFKKRFSLLLNNFWSIIKKQKQLTWLNSWYSQIAIIFPLVVAMPRYLAKEITLGGLMQISSAFGRVQESLSYFVEMYSSIAEWQAVV